MKVFFCFLQWFSYVMSVLYPECLVRLIMEYHSVSFEQVGALEVLSFPVRLHYPFSDVAKAR